jgi:hypothetical protein
MNFVAPSNPTPPPITPQQLQDQQNVQVCKIANVAAATFAIQAVTLGVAGSGLTLTVAGAPAGAFLLGVT